MAQRIDNIERYWKFKKNDKVKPNYVLTLFDIASRVRITFVAIEAIADWLMILNIADCVEAT